MIESHFDEIDTYYLVTPLVASPTSTMTRKNMVEAGQTQFDRRTSVKRKWWKIRQQRSDDLTTGYKTEEEEEEQKVACT